MKYSKIYLIILFLVLFSTSIFSYPWPMRNSGGNFNGPLPITGTLGDARGNATNPRFHRGIDIGRTGGVYSIASGNAIVGENCVRVGEYFYEHLNVMVEPGDPVVGILENPDNPTQIGSVAGNHLHFQIGPPDGPFYNPLSYNGGPYNYDDNAPPVVWGSTYEHWWFWREGSEGQVATRVGSIDNPIIYRKIDIRAYCQDRQINPNLPGSVNTSGIYRLEWGVQDIQGNWIIPLTQTIIFDQVQPPNNGNPVLLVYDRHNYRNESPFYYWVTNPIINNQVEDRYWNTKLRNNEGWNGENARINQEAQTPDGRYIVWVLAYDIRDNGGDMQNRRGAEDTEIIIDNFAPYLSEISLSSQNNKRYSARWGAPQDSLNLEDLNIISSDTFSQDELSNMHIILSFSESMNITSIPQISAYFEASGNNYTLNLQGNWDADATTFMGTLSFPNLSENDTGNVILSISGVQDLAGNQLDSEPHLKKNKNFNLKLIT